MSVQDSSAVRQHLPVSDGPAESGGEYLSNKGLYQASFAFAILTVLGWVAFILGMMGSPDTSGMDRVEAFLAVAQAGTPVLLYAWGGILGALFAIAPFIAMYQAFEREVGTVLLLPVAAAVIGSVLLAQSFTNGAASHLYTYAHAIEEASPAAAAQMVIAAEAALDNFEVMWDLSSFLAYGGRILWIAVLLLRSTATPKWLHVVGIIGGLAGFLWLADFVNIQLPFILLPINIVASLVWLVGVMVVLLRSDRLSVGMHGG